MPKTGAVKPMATTETRSKTNKIQSLANELTDEACKVVAENAATYWAQEYHLNTRGDGMNFKNLHYLFTLYQLIDKTPRMVVEKSVQCGLSELFIIQSHIEAGDRGMSVMYVLPKYEIRNRFVNNRIYKLHQRVPHYNMLLKSADTKLHRTSLMHFGSGTLAYVGSNVESEFLEIPIDSAYVDEKDRCNTSNLLLLPDRYSASPYRFHREISNPTVEGFGIDERYQDSSRGEWQIKCEHCGKWFVPDFWEHVVRQVDDNVYVPRDPNYVVGEYGVAEMIHTCGKPTNRLALGEWIHSEPRKIWKGFRISKLFSKFASLGELIEKWQDSVGNTTKEQVFYNSDLGLPFTSEGAKITEGMLNLCRRPYKWPVTRVDPSNIRLMGIDVGSVLHVVIRERVRTDTRGLEFRLLLACTVESFAEVARLLREWQPRRAVIDSMPEIHKVSELKAEFKNVWASTFQEQAIEPHINRVERKIGMNRTAVLDGVQQGFAQQDLLIPMQGRDLDGGNYYSQLQASTRILETDDEKPEKKPRFMWVHTKPDHYFLAEGYCVQAAILMPRHDVFEYYQDESETMNKRVTRKIVKVGDDQAEKDKIADLQRLTPEIALANINKAYVEPTAVGVPVDDENIWRTCEEEVSVNGYVDAFLVSQITNEHVDDVKRILKAHLYSESRIKGQYIR